MQVTTCWNFYCSYLCRDGYVGVLSSTIIILFVYWTSAISTRTSYWCACNMKLFYISCFDSLQDNVYIARGGIHCTCTCTVSLCLFSLRSMRLPPRLSLAFFSLMTSRPSARSVWRTSTTTSKLLPPSPSHLFVCLCFSSQTEFVVYCFWSPVHLQGKPSGSFQVQGVLSSCVPRPQKTIWLWWPSIHGMHVHVWLHVCCSGCDSLCIFMWQ